MAKAAKPLPFPTADSEPFWLGCKRSELLLQRCTSCQTYRHPPSPRCQKCLSASHEWARASGRGTVYSYVVVHQALHPAFEDEVPYVVAIVELAEGPHMLSNLIDVAIDRVRVGMPLSVCFQPASDEITLAKFRPVQA